MTLNADLLRSSFALVVEREPQLTARFYDRLFDDNPALMPLFSGVDRHVQEEMLTKALVSVLEHLDDEPWLVRELGALGVRHQGYGVTDKMYDQVGASLLATLATVAGPAWTDELSEAWADAYHAIACLMQDGVLRSQALRDHA